MRKVDAIFMFLSVILLSSSVPAGDKHRLSAVPEEADNAYIDGVKAMRAGRLEDAKWNYEKALSISPKHPKAKADLERVKKKLSEKATASKPVKKPVKPTAAQPVAKKTAVRPAPKPVVSSADSKKKSNTLYLQALEASQKGDVSRAYALSRESLRLDPTNLQASRMNERLANRARQP